MHDRNWSVEVPADFAACAFKVEDRGASGGVDFDVETDLRALVAEVESVYELIRWGNDFYQKIDSVEGDEEGRGTHGRSVVEIIYCAQDVRAVLLRYVFQQIPDRHLGVVSDVVHIVLDGLEAVVIDNYVKHEHHSKEFTKCKTHSDE